MTTESRLMGDHKFESHYIFISLIYRVNPKKIDM